MMIIKCGEYCGRSYSCMVDPADPADRMDTKNGMKGYIGIRHADCRSSGDIPAMLWFDGNGHFVKAEHYAETLGLTESEILQGCCNDMDVSGEKALP